MSTKATEKTVVQEIEEVFSSTLTALSSKKGIKISV